MEGKTMKKEKMEVFKRNMEEANFSNEFIQLALNYFSELQEEMEVQEMKTIEEVIDYFARIGSYTCNTLQSENNLKEVREDLYLLYTKDYNNILDFNLYFENIEDFEISVLYVLYFEFYPQEEEEDEEENL